MKTFLMALLILLASTAASTQQEPQPEQEAQRHRSSRKIWIGVGLIGAGAVIVPITSVTAQRSPATSAQTAVGFGLIAVGSGFVWFGSVERHKATSPQTNIGVIVGRYEGLQLRRTW